MALLGLIDPGDPLPGACALCLALLRPPHGRQLGLHEFRFANLAAGSSLFAHENLDGHSYARSWYLEVTCSVSASPEELRKIGLVWEMTFFQRAPCIRQSPSCLLRPKGVQKIGLLCEMTSSSVSYSVHMLGSTADTCTASVYGGFEEAHTFSTCTWTCATAVWRGARGGVRILRRGQGLRLAPRRHHVRNFCVVVGRASWCADTAICAGIVLRSSWFVLVCSLTYVTPSAPCPRASVGRARWCADTSVWARIALSLSMVWCLRVHCRV